jgi:hypothetical protein
MFPIPGTTTAAGVLDAVRDWGGTENLAEVYDDPDVTIVTPPVDLRTRIGLADEALLRSVDLTRFEPLRVPDYRDWYRWPFHGR